MNKKLLPKASKRLGERFSIYIDQFCLKIFISKFTDSLVLLFIHIHRITFISLYLKYI